MMDLGHNPWLLWLAVALVAATVEVLTLDLIFLMIATGAAALVGAEGEVLVAVSRDGGRVKLAGEVWTARSATGGLPLEVGSQVQVVRIDGATAVVAPSSPRAALGGAVPPD